MQYANTNTRYKLNGRVALGACMRFYGVASMINIDRLFTVSIENACSATCPRQSVNEHWFVVGGLLGG